jgi:hypothetical protein
MDGVTKQIVDSIPSDLDGELSYAVGDPDDYMPRKRPGGSGTEVNVPVYLDGQVITKSTARVQVRRNRAYSRALGVTT